MPYRLPDTHDSCGPSVADGYFTPLAAARYLMLTMIGPDGTQSHGLVAGMADGERAFFRARRRSGLVRNLRRAIGLQVARCSALGMVSYEPTLCVTVRLLSDDETGRVADELARRHRSRFPVRRRPPMTHWELRPVLTNAPRRQGPPPATPLRPGERPPRPDGG